MLLTTGLIIISLLALGLVVDFQFKRFGELKNERLGIAELEVDLLGLRRQEKDFLSRRDLKYAAGFDTGLAEMAQTFDKLTTRLDASSIDSLPVTSAKNLINRYGEQFQQIVELQKKIGLNEKDGLYGALRSAVRDVESQLDQHIDYQLKSQMLMLRRAEKDFMLRRNLKYQEKFGSSLASMIEAVASSDLPASVRLQVSEKLQRYGSDFNALVSAEQEIGLTHKDGKLGDLRSTVHSVDEEFAQLKANVGLSIADAETTLKTTLFATIAIIVATVAVVLLLLSRVISRRTRQVTQNMREISQGDGDLTRRLDASGKDEFAALGAAFNDFAAKIHDTLQHTAEMVAKLSETGQDVGVAAASTDKSMQQLRSNTHTVVVATEELSATAHEVASSASHVSTAAQEANALAEDGRNTVQNSVDAINSFASEFNEAGDSITQLRAETDNIGGILDVIRGIAEQTNLLALNAAIEAARAGEQGRGFAVVADEVRTLAHRSQESTNEIQGLIERLQDKAESAVGKIQHGQNRIAATVSQAEQAGQALGRITDSIGSISGMTVQIATAAEEQTAVVVDIASNIVAIDELAQSTTSDADRTNAATAELARFMSAVTHELQHFQFENHEQPVLK
jgi:methyl-accepting chemotaxis protein